MDAGGIFTHLRQPESWKRPRTPPYPATESTDSTEKSIHFEAKSVNFEAKSVNFEAKSVNFEAKSVNFEAKSANFTVESANFFTGPGDFVAESIGSDAGKT